MYLRKGVPLRHWPSPVQHDQYEHVLKFFKCDLEHLAECLWRAVAISARAVCGCISKMATDSLSVKVCHEVPGHVHA
jgi:hypothetical protein